jgi:hypothetical protein
VPGQSGGQGGQEIDKKVEAVRPNLDAEVKDEQRMNRNALVGTSVQTGHDACGRPNQSDLGRN